MDTLAPTVSATVSAIGAALALQMPSEALPVERGSVDLGRESLAHVKPFRSAARHETETFYSRPTQSTGATSLVHSAAASPLQELLSEIQIAYKNLPTGARQGRLSENEFPVHLRLLQEKYDQHRIHIFDHPKASIDARVEAVNELRSLHTSLTDMAVAFPRLAGLTREAESLQRPWNAHAQQLAQACRDALRSGDGSALKERTANLEKAIEVAERARFGSDLLSFSSPFIVISAWCLQPTLLRRKLDQVITRAPGLDLEDREFLEAKLAGAASRLQLLSQTPALLGYIIFRTGGGAKDAVRMFNNVISAAWCGLAGTSTALMGLSLMSNSTLLTAGSIVFSALACWKILRSQDPSDWSRVLTRERGMREAVGE